MGGSVNSPMIDVPRGLIFVYLVLSHLASSIPESSGT